MSEKYDDIIKKLEYRLAKAPSVEAQDRLSKMIDIFYRLKEMNQKNESKKRC